jgi:ribonuclease BN (tRNA processing enzyme)
MEFSLIVNGAGNAFLREFGCPCGRCADRQNRATTSVSVVARDEKSRKIIWHALVDAGPGVVESLVNAFPPEEARLDWLLLTHWHPDHTLDLNRLCETARRTSRRRGQSFVKIPTWCRAGTGKWLQKNYSYEWYRCLDPRVGGESHPPGALLDPVPTGIPAVRITPFSVSHAGADLNPENFKEPLPCSASFVIETLLRKTVLLWDLDNRNDWILSTAGNSPKGALEKISNPDLLFIDCFSWTVEEMHGFNTGHLSFQSVRRYVKALNPRETFLVHMSGHEEGEGNPGFGWTDDRWEEEARSIWRAEGLPGKVSVARTGREISL